jgi:hypothetical protein
MRVSSLVFTAVAALAAPFLAQAQTPAEKAKPAAAATVKPSVAPKAALQNDQAVKGVNKAKIEGTAATRAMPADMKKDSDCHSKGNASDA